MKNRIIYLLIGVCLIFALNATSFKSIDDNTLELLKSAQGIDTELIWSGFDISEYPIDVNYGNKEFRYFNGTIEERKPDIKVLALSAVETDVGPVVKVVPEYQVRKVMDSGDLSLSERNIIYKTVIIHEGFHCFQMENGMSSVEVAENEIISSNRDEFEKYKSIQERIDNDEHYQKLWIDEVNELVRFYTKNDKERWLSARSDRIDYEKKKLGEDFNIYNKWVNNMELAEGSARYVEQKALEQLSGNEFMPEIQDKFSKGDVKFYLSGSYKILILMRENKWKDIRFDDSITLDELLIK